MKNKSYKVSWEGYVALGVGENPATQEEADSYGVTPDGYVDLAVEKLKIADRVGDFELASKESADRVAEFISSKEGADCYGVAVRGTVVT